jgi:hypothetical protein
MSIFETTSNEFSAAMLFLLEEKSGRWEGGKVGGCEEEGIPHSYFALPPTL